MPRDPLVCRGRRWPGGVVQVNVVNERARQEGAIGSSLETQVVVTVPHSHPLLPHLHALQQCGDLRDVLSTSQVTVLTDDAVVAEAAAAAAAAAVAMPAPTPGQAPAAGGSSLAWSHCSFTKGSPGAAFSYSALATLPGVAEPVRCAAVARLCWFARRGVAHTSGYRFGRGWTSTATVQLPFMVDAWVVR
jgi:hypothetical protein